MEEDMIWRQKESIGKQEKVKKLPGTATLILCMARTLSLDHDPPKHIQVFCSHQLQDMIYFGFVYFKI
jgi:hypothetical protein